MALFHLHREVEGLLGAGIRDVRVSQRILDKVNQVVDHVELQPDLRSHSARFEYKGLVGLVLRSQGSNATVELHQSLVEGLAALLDIEGLRGSRLLHGSTFLVPGPGRLFDSLGLKGRSLLEFLLILSFRLQIQKLTLSFRLQTQSRLPLSRVETGRFESGVGVI